MQQSCPEPCSCVPVGTPVLQKPKSKLPVGPVMLGFFLFVVVGSGECCAQLASSAGGGLLSCMAQPEWLKLTLDHAFAFDPPTQPFCKSSGQPPLRLHLFKRLEQHTPAMLQFPEQVQDQKAWAHLPPV